MAPAVVTTRTRLLISSTKVPTAFATSGAGRELLCPTQLAHLIAAVLPDTLWPFVLCRPTSEFQVATRLPFSTASRCARPSATFLQ